MFGRDYTASLSDSEIEERARGLGMHTEEDCKVFFERNEEK